MFVWLEKKVLKGRKSVKMHCVISSVNTISEIYAPLCREKEDLEQTINRCVYETGVLTRDELKKIAGQKDTWNLHIDLAMVGFCRNPELKNTIHSIPKEIILGDSTYSLGTITLKDFTRDHFTSLHYIADYDLNIYYDGMSTGKDHEIQKDITKRLRRKCYNH